MGEPGGPPSLSCSFYSARLLLRIVGETRVASSVLRARRFVRRKLSFQQQDTEDEKDRNWDCEGTSPTDYFSVTPPVKRRKVRSWRNRDSCYLCKLRYKRLDEIEPCWYPCIPEVPKNNIVYLPITRSQPPKPPLRSSSLPYFKHFRRLALTTNPSAPLSHFQLSQRDGTFFQWMALAHADKHGLHEFMDPIWGLVLQISHDEPCVRHLLLGWTVLQHNYHFGLDSWGSVCKNRQRHILRHYMSALQILSHRLVSIKGKADPRIWEVSFVASYLFAIFQLALHDAKGGYFWLKAGYRILKDAFRAFGSEIHGLGLPASMRDVARAFGRLDTRAISTDRLVQKERP